MIFYKTTTGVILREHAEMNIEGAVSVVPCILDLDEVAFCFPDENKDNEQIVSVTLKSGEVVTIHEEYEYFINEIMPKAMNFEWI